MVPVVPWLMGTPLQSLPLSSHGLHRNFLCVCLLLCCLLQGSSLLGLEPMLILDALVLRSLPKLHLQRILFQIKWHSEVPLVKTPTDLLGGDTIQHVIPSLLKSFYYEVCRPLPPNKLFYPVHLYIYPHLVIFSILFFLEC